MIKILFCIHRLSPFYKVIPKSFEELEFDVELFDYYQPNFNIRFLGFINNLYQFDKNRVFINKQINQALINKASKYRPDYLFMIKGLDIENSTIEKIKSMRIIVINWFQDLLQFMPWLIKHASVYDYLFTPDPLMQRELKKKEIKSYYIPLATIPDKEYISHPKKYGVVFSGQYTERRGKLFNKLKTLGKDFVIWGYPTWRKTSFSEHYCGLLPSVDTMLSNFRESKIVINVQTAEDKYPSDVVSLRAFEATGVGTFLLNWRHKCIDDFWEDGKEIVNFTTADEALEKAKFYLTHDNKREKIAKKGWLRTKSDHTYIKRLKEMFKIIEENERIK